MVLCNAYIRLEYHVTDGAKQKYIPSGNNFIFSNY